MAFTKNNEIRSKVSSSFSCGIINHKFTQNTLILFEQKKPLHFCKGFFIFVCGTSWN
jgi:hypothetical protein